MKKIYLIGLAVGSVILLGLYYWYHNRSTRWFGDAERQEFKVAGRNCQLYVPDQPAAGKPWIWRTEFIGEFPYVDSVLLEKGYHVAYIDVKNMYGSPQAMALMDSFYTHLTTQKGLSAQPTMEGFSRGGLFALNWAYAHPDRVSSLYLDAPVCDFKSWPAGRGAGPGSPKDWENLLKSYQFTPAEALRYKGNPVDNVRILAIANTPILSVCGAKDTLVPMPENTNLLAGRYTRWGGQRFRTIVKPNVGHHPHSLTDPAPIIAFIESYQR